MVAPIISICFTYLNDGNIDKHKDDPDKPLKSAGPVKIWYTTFLVFHQDHTVCNHAHVYVCIRFDQQPSLNLSQKPDLSTVYMVSRNKQVLFLRPGE